jgi:nucleoside-triphosphatase THEP1
MHDAPAFGGVAVSETRRVKNLLLTGRPGVGKTTVVQAVVGLFPGELGGFFTEEIRERGTRRGFSISSVEGESAVMAHADLRSPVRVGKYGVDVAAFERIALPALRGAIQRKQIIVIDEIGKMELVSRNFFEAVREALSWQICGGDDHAASASVCGRNKGAAECRGD